MSVPGVPKSSEYDWVMRTPYFAMPDTVLPEYVTSLTPPLVASDLTLIRSPYIELVTVFPEIVTPETVFPDEIEPIEIPWPPEHTLFLNTMLDPAFIAMQSSWFLITLFWIVTSLEEQSIP